MPHHVSWPNQVRVRFRKQSKRKRRLAYARSGLLNFGISKESEYWSFPLPPISPHVASLRGAASSVDLQADKSQVKVLTEGTFRPTTALLCMQALHVYVPNGLKVALLWDTYRFCAAAKEEKKKCSRFRNAKKEILKAHFQSSFLIFFVSFFS